MEVRQYIIPIALGVVALVAGIAFAYWYFTSKPQIEITDYELY